MSQWSCRAMNYKAYIIQMTKSYTNQLKSSKHQVVQLIHNRIAGYDLSLIVH